MSPAVNLSLPIADWLTPHSKYHTVRKGGEQGRGKGGLPLLVDVQKQERHSDLLLLFDVQKRMNHNKNLIVTRL